MRISKHFIQLPFSFDAERLAAEIEQFDSSAWFSHVNGFPGRDSLVLISKNGENNNEFNGKMSATPHLEASPYHQQVLASFDEVLGRSRLMRLQGGSEVSMHVDMNYHWRSRVRIHIPVITNPNVIFFCGNEKIHMKAGECWIFDSWRPHRVVNNSPHTRIHLVIDTSGSSRFWNMVREMEAYDFRSDQSEISKIIKHIPFDDQKKPVVEIEKYNVTPVIEPGEMDALVDDLIRDFVGKPKNDPQLSERYRQMLIWFAKDWREVWHEHGREKSGWPLYQNLAEKLRNSLHPEVRALTTKSNHASVNNIITQQILASALNIDVVDEWRMDTPSASETASSTTQSLQ